MDPVEKLKRDGIAILDDYIGGDELWSLQWEFAVKAEKEIPDETGKICIDMPPLRMPEVDRWMDAYHGGPCEITVQAARRYLPSDLDNYASFQWHVDCTGLQTKAMLLLTDVGPQDQHMNYIPGTHREKWPIQPYEASRFTAEQAMRRGQFIECCGKAGTVILFDTNGIHRGNRSLTRHRDTITLYYTKK